MRFPTLAEAKLENYCKVLEGILDNQMTRIQSLERKVKEQKALIEEQRKEIEDCQK